MTWQRPALPLTTAYVAAASSSAAAALYTVLALDPAPIVSILISFGPLVAVLLWLQEDARRLSYIQD